MPDHGTTTACSEECDRLLSLKNGRQRHTFVLQLAVDQDRKRAYKAAGYSGGAWRSNAAKLLSNSDVWASFAAHLQSADGEIVEWGERLRGMTRVRAGAKLANITNCQDPNPEGIARLRTLIEDGVEDRRADGDVRPATDAEIADAADAVRLWKLLPMSEWPETEREALIGWQETKKGKMMPIFQATENAKLSAQLEGMLTTRLHVSFEEAQSSLREQWDAVSSVLEIAVPELRTQLLAAMAWWVGKSVELVPGEGKVVRGEGEGLEWDGGWVV